MSARWMMAGIAALLAAPVLAQDEVKTPDQLADLFEYALVAGDYRMLPRAEGFTYVENGAELKPWDGMWQTTTALEGAAQFPDLDYRVEFAFGDTVVRLVESNENGTKGVLAYRLLAQDGAIVRIDTLPIREEFTGARSGTISLMQPMIPNTMDGAKIGPAAPVDAGGPLDAGTMERAVAYYFSAYSDDRNDPDYVLPAFAPECVRRDNGQLVTNLANAPVLDPAKPDFRPYALSCEEQLASGFYANLRLGGQVLYLDPASRQALAFVRLDQAGTKLEFAGSGHIGLVTYPGPRGMPQAVDTSEQFDGRISENMITPLSINGIYLFAFNEEGSIQSIDVMQRGAPLGWTAMGGLDD